MPAPSVAGARHSPSRGSCQDARLPCWRSMANRSRVDVSIIVLNYNTCEHLRACLEALLADNSTALAGGPLRAEVFVVDNASSDGSADMVAAEFPWVQLIRSPRNGGFADGNNQALQRVRGEGG